MFIEKLAIGLLIFSLLGSTASGMSMLPRFNKSKNIVPMSESKSKRTIRCKGELTFDKKGNITGCTENYYLDEQSQNKEERKMTLKEKLLGFLGNLKGFFFWLILASVGASMLGFGGLVGGLWSNLFGAASKALRVTVRAIKRAKKNGGNYIEELDRAHSDADPVVQKKINEIRAKLSNND